MVKSKVLYQTKLILDTFPKEDYELIPKEILNYITQNMKIDENIKIDSNKSLEEQNISYQTYELLNKIITRIESNKRSKQNTDISQNYFNSNIAVDIKKENDKIVKLKLLAERYNTDIQLKNDEINKLKLENYKLNSAIQKLPKIIQKLFLKI